MGSSDILGIGLSGALASERRLSTAGHNIANAQTDGFSRQRVEVDTRPPQFSGVGSLGTGVQISNVKRVNDAFVTGEVFNNASLYNGLQQNYEFTSQVDNMLADPDAGLAPTIHQFFASINGVSNDPSSQSSRQVMIGQANSLSERFEYLNNRFDTLRRGTNETLKTQVKEVNDLAKAIADVNWKVVLAKEVTQGEPSDLLDQRERLLHRLAEKIDVRTSEQEDGSLNVFIGNGQTLVIGKNAAGLELESNEHDPTILEVIYNSRDTRSIVTKFLNGGSIGGLLEFRQTMLDDSQNELGRIAIGVAKTFNDQHKKGMTLNNELGGDFFKPIDSTSPLSLPSGHNKGDYELKTTVTNVDNLTVSDYILSYRDGIYTLQRNSDNQVVGKYDSLPQQLESEGFKIELDRGSTIENGDSFMIRPTRAAIIDFGVDIKNTNDIAAAAPVRVRSSVHNLGDVDTKLTSITNIDAPTFRAAEGSLSPTVTVRFINENRIELLDSDGNVIKTQQLYEQAKNIPATPAIPADDNGPGTPATPAIPAIPADPKKYGLEDIDEESGETKPPMLETGIAYDPEVGINLFPTPGGFDTGYTVHFEGKAKAGDTFVIEFNTDAVGDNSNVLELGSLQHSPVLANGTASYNEVYSQLVSRVGSKTHELDVNREAQSILYESAKAQKEAVSGVNLDEEAANLIRYQQAYQANAQVINAAHEMFNTLISVMNR